MTEVCHVSIPSNRGSVSDFKESLKDVFQSLVSIPSNRGSVSDQLDNLYRKLAVKSLNPL
ncbi:hypothetical protein MTBBW1_1350002 [Desulfamplus magnetovallimortis]|uniref:Uncharacterized protein n=1 Tax=Desulfamplus magnetovallimortis TaxID=1246637 RepID=A0A1W1H7K0_9BACT|nr:hypothetical protein MTBBW1_1350002 [Desulfamplus magnetovallimortis]